LRALPLIVAAALGWAGTVSAQPAYPITVEALHEPFGDIVRARNEGAVPISVILLLDASENLATDAAWPVAAVIAPHSSARLAQLSPAKTLERWHYQYTWRYRPGAFNAAHDPKATYRVPYPENAKFPIVQSALGPITTHTTADSRDAVDISMPEGTPILAARDGIVIHTAADHRVGGMDESLRSKANVVRIVHADGTIGNYAHLSYAGVVVRPGDFVRAGTLLGYSGTTGFSGGPHLHFGVTRVVRSGADFDEVSVPFTFAPLR
jgi:murein DD-endopeptidase MepM/ murein hydrolase activator NlpD